MAAPNYFVCPLGAAAQVTGSAHRFRSINDLITQQAKLVPDSPAVGVYVSSTDQPWQCKVHSFRTIEEKTAETAKNLLQHFPDELVQKQTVGLLCTSSPKFLAAWLALCRLGKSVLLIAPQCHSAAILHLCKACDASLLLHDERYQELAKQAAQLSRDQDDHKVKAALMPSFKTNNISTSIQESELEFQDVDPNTIAYYHHTSGTSSGLPKPIPQPHSGAVGVLPRFEDGSKKATFTTTPLYHGGVADLFRAWSSNAMIWLFPEKEVAMTAANITKCLELANEAATNGSAPPVAYFSSVPYVLQMMAADPKALRHLQSMDIVGVGGAALPPEIGNRLAHDNVNLVSRYGSAECGFLMSSHRDYKTDQEWQYLRNSKGGDLLRFEKREDGTAELVVKSGWPHMAKRNHDDGSYATADLFAPHESIPNAWKYHSRADSQLTLITGKKFDPAPLEDSLATSGFLRDVLIFGNDQPYPGALLFRSDRYQKITDANLITAIAPAVEKLNAESQQHARIPKNMLVPMSFEEVSLEKSSKGTILRRKAEEKFAHHIRKAYAHSTLGNQEIKDEDLSDALLQLVASIIGRNDNLDIDTGLFEFGADSVACIQLRANIINLLPKSKTSIPLTIVEDCGTIRNLASYVLRRRNGEEHAAESSDAVHKQMEGLVKQYGNFPATSTADDADCRSRVNDSKGEVVLITGATGALGAHILSQYLTAKSLPRKVYCLVRGASPTAAAERVHKALESRKLTLAKSKDTVEVLQAKLSDEHLGLSETVYLQLAKEVTKVIHCAWAVNFRLPLQGFVKDHILGLRYLLDFAILAKSSPKFVFCSSTASSIAHSSCPIPETIIDTPQSAGELGYARSKWVAEQICTAANTQTCLRGRIAVLRIGQLSGDTQHGIWNTSEAWPLMLNSVRVTGSLPDLGRSEVLDWLPVDIAAKCCVEVTDIEGNDPSKEKAMKVYHMLNDRTDTSWQDLQDWLEKIENESHRIRGPNALAREDGSKTEGRYGASRI